jgi:hypothetical protein
MIHIEIVVQRCRLRCVLGVPESQNRLLPQVGDIRPSVGMPI